MSNEMRLTEKAGLELVNLRGELASTGFNAAVRQILGLELPATPNTVVSGPEYRALWLGPDEWLLQSTSPCTPGVERTLRPLIGTELAAVVDVSSGYTVLELTGARVREVLRKGCPLDVHPRVFAVGQCAQTHFFKAGIILRPAARDAYELIVRRSFADYTARMLLDAAAE